MNDSHLDAIDWTRRQAQLTPCAFIRNDGVHESACPDDGVYRTGRNAFSAPYAPVFIDPCDAARLVA